MGAKRRQSGPRITLPTVAVLRVMLDDPTGDHYGLALAEETHFPSGTIYPVLARLEKAGWLSSFWEDGDPVALERPRRRLYRLTGHGALAAREALDTATQRMFGAPQPAYQPRPGAA